MLIPFMILSIVSSTSCISQQKILPNDTNLDNIDQIFTPDDFFPQLYIEDYNEYIEFDNNAKPYISDKLIFTIITDVLERVSSSLGRILFSVNIYSKQMIDFNFTWEYNQVKLSKTYSINILKCV